MKENRMDVNNVAIVIGPNFVRSDKETCTNPENILMEMEWTNLVVEKLIVHVHEIFK